MEGFEATCAAAGEVTNSINTGNTTSFGVLLAAGGVALGVGLLALWTSGRAQPDQPTPLAGGRRTRTRRSKRRYDEKESDPPASAVQAQEDRTSRCQEMGEGTPEAPTPPSEVRREMSREELRELGAGCMMSSVAFYDGFRSSSAAASANGDDSDQVHTSPPIASHVGGADEDSSEGWCMMEE